MLQRRFLTALFFLVMLSIPASVQASHGTHLLISEIQTTGGAGLTKNDFVELYNPTGATIDLNGMRLVKRTATGTTDTTLKSWTESTLVPVHGYYLWANTDFATISATPDTKTIQTIADDNGVALRQGAENTGTIIDAVSWGTGAAAFIEGTAFSQNPTANQSIERKPGGTDGNGTDTNNNATDFSLKTATNPQNTLSAPAPAISSPPPPSGPVCGNGNCETGEDATSCAPDCAAPPPPAVIQPGEIVINEFVPDPLDGTEWIELYNTTTRSIDLAGSKLLDGTGNSIKTLSGAITAQGFFVAELSSARLNNSGDRIILQSPASATIDAVSYGDWNDGATTDNAPVPSKSGQSVARKTNGGDSNNDKNDFIVSDTPTKNSSNVITVTTLVPTGGTNISPTATSVPRPKIVINEFVSDPDDGPEWVELYNAGEVSVDLEGWYLEDGSEAKTKLSGTLVPGHFKTFSDISGSLNNKGDIIRLKNEKDETVDRVSFGPWEDGTPSDNAPIAEDPYSVARRQDGKDTDNDAADFVVTAKLTKGKANVIVEVPQSSTDAASARHPERSEGSLANASNRVDPAAEQRDSSPRQLAGTQNDRGENLSGKLIISEIMPDPEGSDDSEWVELYWAGDADLHLDGFQIDDAEGGSRPYTVDTLLMLPRSYVILPKSRTHLTLNNDSDNVRLLDSTGKLIDLVEYENADEGIAYAKADDNNWHWTSTPTPTAANNITEHANTDDADKEDDAAYVETSLSEIKDFESGKKVRVKGVVSAPPGILGSQIFYIAGSGVQIYSAKKTFPKLTLGDTITVQGILSEAYGEQRIKIKSKDDIVFIGHGKPPPAHDLSADDLNEDAVGTLAHMDGTIIDTTKNSFALNTETGEVYVAIKSSTGIDMRELIPGSNLSLTGIIGAASRGIQILPRFQEDLEITGQDNTITGPISKLSPSQDTSSPPYTKTTAYAGSAVALSALAIRRRQLFMTGARAIAFFIRRGKNQV